MDVMAWRMHGLECAHAGLHVQDGRATDASVRAAASVHHAISSHKQQVQCMRAIHNRASKQSLINLAA
jgi:hypothetical protein